MRFLKRDRHGPRAVHVAALVMFDWGIEHRPWGGDSLLVEQGHFDDGLVIRTNYIPAGQNP
jgi:hypothetical protein